MILSDETGKQHETSAMNMNESLLNTLLAIKCRKLFIVEDPYRDGVLVRLKDIQTILEISSGRDKYHLIGNYAGYQSFQYPTNNALFDTVHQLNVLGIGQVEEFETL